MPSRRLKRRTLAAESYDTSSARLLTSEPSLLARNLERQAVWKEVIAEGMAARLGAEPETCQKSIATNRGPSNPRSAKDCKESRLGATLLQHPFECHMATCTITLSEVSKELAPIQRR